MKMRTDSFLKPAALVLGLFAGLITPALAATEASVYVVHGIPGQDLGLEASLPVDVLVNGELCALQSFKFGEIVGPIPLPAGNYDFAISLANTESPCSSDPVITASGVPLAAGENASVVAHLDAEGKPTASKFTNDVTAMPPGMARLILHHTASAPAVDVDVRRPGALASGVTVGAVSNGEQVSTQMRPGTYQVSIRPAGTNVVVFGPAPVGLRPFNAYLVYAVGSPTSGTLTLLTNPVFVKLGKNTSAPLSAIRSREGRILRGR